MMLDSLVRTCLLINTVAFWSRCFVVIESGLVTIRKYNIIYEQNVLRSGDISIIFRVNKYKYVVNGRTSNTSIN